MMKNWANLRFFICGLVVNGGTVAAQTPARPTPRPPMTARDVNTDERDMEAAIRLFQLGKLEQAEPILARIAGRGAGTRRGELAQYYIAETQFRLKKYRLANASFESLVTQYPGTEFLEKLVSRQYAIALQWLPIDEASALRTLDQVRHHYPDGPAATAALIQMIVHEMKKGKESEAWLYNIQLDSNRPNGSWLADLRRIQEFQQEGKAVQLESAGAIPRGTPGELDRRASMDSAVVDILRDHFDTLLKKKLLELDQKFVLTDEQRKKLALAGRGDIARIVDLAVDTLRKADPPKYHLRHPIHVQDRFRPVEGLLVRPPFEPGSLFDKTLRKLMNDKQLKKKLAAGEKVPMGA